MKTELKIQKLLRTSGLDYAISYLNLDVKHLDNLVLLKYKQIEVDWNKKENLECRGIILDKDNNFEVVAFPYNKFFNLHEGHCATIDWNSAEFFSKMDGSLMNLYFYKNEWHVQTSGTINADARTNHATLKFVDLFWMSVERMYKSKENFIALLNTRYNYMFELCTEWNIVVTPHTGYEIWLHGVRDMHTYEFIRLDEIDGLYTVKRYNLSNLDEMYKEIENMTWQDEGFIVVDKYFNRAKCKNPTYVEMHHSVTGVSPYSIVEIIKTNEQDEYLSYFKHKTEEVLFIKTEWDKIVNYLTDYYDQVKDIVDNKEFALKIIADLEKSYASILFNMRNGNIQSIHDGMCRIHNRVWYNKFYKL